MKCRRSSNRRSINVGSDNGRAILTEDRVNSLRHYYAQRLRLSGKKRLRDGWVKERAEYYGVSVKTIYAALSGRRWK